MIAVFQVLKLYAWEPYFEEKLFEIRKKETDNLRIFWMLVAASNVLWICTPFVVSLCWHGNPYMTDLGSGCHTNAEQRIHVLNVTVALSTISRC